MITLKDIAAKAGCSISVASRALNPDVAQHRTVAIATAQKILTAAKQLGYQPRHENSRRKAAGVIGVFLPDDRSSLVLDMVTAIATEATRVNTPLHFYFGLHAEDYRRFAETYGNVSYSVGMITYFPDYDQQVIVEIQKTIEIIKKQNGKIVLLQSSNESVSEFPVVAINNFYGGYLAGEHLVRKQCSEYFCICSGLAKYRADRFSGFQNAMHEGKCNFTVFQKTGLASEKGEIEKIVEKIVKISEMDHEHKIGIFIDADPVAIMAIDFFLKSGIDIGKQVFIVGYDDIYSSSLLASGLTTVRQPFTEVGKTAMRKMINLLKGFPESSSIIKPELIIRGTA